MRWDASAIRTEPIRSNSDPAQARRGRSKQAHTTPAWMLQQEREDAAALEVERELV